MIEFLGHFHPLLVHLPIGILLIALLLQWLSRKKKYAALQQAVPVILLTGAITGLFSCITGYLLSISDDYDKNLVNWHTWMGIATTLTAFVLYAREKNDQFKINKTFLSVALLILIALTGHLGGSLTHGYDYLSKPLKNIFNNDAIETTAIKPIANVQEAQVYADVIKPIFQTKCYSCHGPYKQKGKLRMDDSLKLMKGGKDGVVIEPGNADASELIKRMLLPADNDDHMPPKEKPQPTENQLALIHWWIANGASLDKKVSQLPQDDKIKPALTALQNVSPEIKPTSDLPSSSVEPADANVIKQLKEKNILVLPVALNSNYVSVSFINDTIVDDKYLQLITKLSKQLVSLKLSNTNISDDGLKTIMQCHNLIKLFLDNTHITDAGLKSLVTLQNLRYLNLVNTKVSAQGINQLKTLPKLKSVYLYKTLVSKQDWPGLQQAFPKTQLDSGGYIVPALTTDTTTVKVEIQY
ncbi:c-type cytochrome domain-containing protein [Parafilimonas sp.]|uniref:c-type cytochrome domain-containing protein n=1 Tax=Parafilimonas sp. TaxID=1969739 RepID=UPI0039E29C78